MKNYKVIFTSVEMDLLESVVGKRIRPYSGIFVFAYDLRFTLEEMEELERTLEKALHDSFDRWLDMLHEEEKRLGRKPAKPTQAMRDQWKHTGRIEEIYDRIAEPLGKSKRCKDDLTEYL